MVAGVVVTVGVAWFAVREFDWRATWASLLTADLRYIALAVGAMLLNIVLKAQRWLWLFHPRPLQMRTRDLLSALLVGQLGNVTLPSRLGDVARIGIVHAKAGVALSGVLLTIVAEKALDGVMLALLLVALLPFVAWPTWLATTQLLLGVLLAAGLVAVLSVATRETARQHVARVSQRLRFGSVPRWVERSLQSLDAWRAVLEGRVQARLWTLSAAIWLLAGLVNYFGFRAVALELPLTAGLLLAVTEIAGTRLAYTPAAIGVYHSIAILTLAPFGTNAADALSAALLLHLVVYLPILIGGLAGVWLEGLDWRKTVSG